MQALERDGRAYEFQYMGIVGEEDRLLQEYSWLDQDFCSQLQQHDRADTGEALTRISTSSAAARQGHWHKL